MERAMSGGRNISRAGGALLAAAIVLGVVIGVVLRQPSIGMVAGLAVGLVAAGAGLAARSLRRSAAPAQTTRPTMSIAARSQSGQPG